MSGLSGWLWESDDHWYDGSALEPRFLPAGLRSSALR